MKFNFIKFHKINILTVLFTAFFLVPVFSFAQTGPTELYLETDLNIVIDGVPLVYPPYGTVFIDSISPSSNLKAGDLITITGTGFETASNAIYFTPASGGSTITVPNVSTIDTTKISLPIPSSIISGSYLVSVDTPNGGLSNEAAISVGSLTELPILFSADANGVISLIADPNSLTPKPNDLTSPSIEKIPASVAVNQNVPGAFTYTFKLSPIKVVGTTNYLLMLNSGGITNGSVLGEITVVSAFPVAGSCPTGYTLVLKTGCLQINQSEPELIFDTPSVACEKKNGEFNPTTGECVIKVAAGNGTPAGNATPGNGILDPIVPCDGVKVPDNTDPNFRECDFNMLMTLARNIINFLLVFSTAIAAACFFFAGYLYLTAGGNVGQVTRAHSIFKNVAVGLIIALSAWLIVNTILTALIPSGADNYSLLKNA